MLNNIADFIGGSFMIDHICMSVDSFTLWPLYVDIRHIQLLHLKPVRLNLRILCLLGINLNW